ncbi:LysR family transcriptional regulator [Secundilactobacillus kimchicus]|uniref:LysR family transcriptional regulator n=1 Tax=Secundilactobacillus kimchicus TaxID=528209 RepID=UPI0024A8ABD1|nr:LysR family transcriptional regulator [Secundilactobacillus kimchicus]
MDKLIATFLVVYETRNFSVAARQLFISQPSVSVQINQLESRLGVTLFNRNGRRQIEPTQAAKRLYEASQPLTAQWKSLVNDLQQLDQHPTWQVALGFSQTASVELLPQVMPSLLKLGNFELSLHTMNSEAILQGVLNQSLVYGVIEKPMVVDGLVQTTLPGDQLVLAGDLEAPLWLVREPGSGVRHYTEAYFREMKIHPEKTLTVDSNQTIVGLLKVGVGKTIIAESLVPAELPVAPLGAAFKRHFYLVGRSDQSNPQFRALWEMIETAAVKRS